MAIFTSTTYNSIRYNNVKSYTVATPYNGGFNSVTYNKVTYNQSVVSSTDGGSGIPIISGVLAYTYNRLPYNGRVLSTLTLPTPVVVVSVYGGYNSMAYMDIAYNDISDGKATYTLGTIVIAGTSTMTASIGKIHMSIPTSYITMYEPEDTRIVMYA